MALYDLVRDFAGPGATVVAATVAGIVAIVFQKRQVEIGQQQAETARQQAATALAVAETGRNKLKFELFEERYHIYKLISEFMDEMWAMQDVDADWLHQRTNRFFVDTSPVKWMFGDDVREWIDVGLMPAVRQLSTIALMGRPLVSGTYEVDVAKVIENTKTRSDFLHVYSARDRVFSSYLKIDF